MEYNHDRIKSNARHFYQINKVNAILVPFICSLIIYGAGAISVIVPFLGTIAAMIFLTFPLQMGMVSWFQKAIHRDGLSLDSAFDGFKNNYLSNVGTMCLKTLYIFLWSLLFYVPGIIKAISYSMTEFIKSENPNIPASRAIELSMIMTNGYKGKLFYLYLSFLGWFILSGFTFGILAIVYVVPYYNASMAFAYEELKYIAINSGKISEQEFGR